MSEPHRNRATTRRLVLVGLHLPAILLLQACSERASHPVKMGVEQDRPVFGTPREQVPPGTESRTANTGKQLSLKNKSQERARTAEPTLSKSQEESAPERSQVGDPGERANDDRQVVISSNRTEREPVPDRFLHYQPPGSTVGDSGELTKFVPEEPAEVSTAVVRELLRRWADTLLARNLASHMNLYAPTLYRFHGSSNVPAESIKAAKQRVLSEITGLQRFEMHDVRLLRSRDGSVTAEFRVESDTAAASLAGSYRLLLRQVGGVWKIYEEERVQPMSQAGKPF